MDTIQFLCKMLSFGKVKKFTFPYSDDKLIKRQQIWNNLQKGILFEDKQIFLEWRTSFYFIDNYAEKRINSGDRVEWFLGKRTILDGYESRQTVMKWIWKGWYRSFGETTEFLGFDFDGNERFLSLRGKLTDLLGEPTKVKLEDCGGLQLGEIVWKNKGAEISIYSFDQFAFKYFLKIGRTNSWIL